MTDVRCVNDLMLIEELGRDAPPAMVLFHGAGDLPGLRARKLFQAAAREIGDRARFLAVDLCENPSMRRRFSITSRPTVILFVAGMEGARRVDPVDASEIRALYPRGTEDPFRGGKGSESS